jgi:hypothetical protein
MKNAVPNVMNNLKRISAHCPNPKRYKITQNINVTIAIKAMR